MSKVTDFVNQRKSEIEVTKAVPSKDSSRSIQLFLSDADWQRIDQLSRSLQMTRSRLAHQIILSALDEIEQL